MKFFRFFKKHALTFYWLAAILFFEILSHGAMYGKFSHSFRYALGFAAAMGLALGALNRIFPKRAVFPVGALLCALLTVLYGSQMVYCFIFGTPYSVSQMGLGADAMTQFWRELLSTMADHWLWIAALLIPMAVLILLRRLHLTDRAGVLACLVSAVCAALLFGAVCLGIRAGGTAMYSDYYFFTSPHSTTSQTAERFGLPMTFYLELTQTEQPVEEEAFILPSPTAQAAEESDEPEEDLLPYNILDIDFDALSKTTDDEKLLNLNAYCASLPGTRQNAYTGKFRDYNLILICAESFSPAAVDPVLTPTLYRLTHEGYIFKNYYNSFPNTTTDGEYALLQGIFPDASRDINNPSMIASVKHYIPFALGNFFRQELGIQSRGYHNNLGSYYHRETTHPKLGYEMQFNHAGMTFKNAWPHSDYEMMVQSVDDYIHDEQFHTYYMTFSGHYQYRHPGQSMTDRNWDKVADLPGLGDVQKSYIACNIELEKAMEYLVGRLREEGIADKTLIVLAADHFPYGLNRKQYFGILGEEYDYFRMYKSDLIFWVDGMESVEIDEYCCNVDILPTLLNLWGFPYDSRLLAGTDIFSDSPHMAVLIDHSFLTDKVWFDTNTGEVRYQVDEDTVDENYVEEMNQRIASKFYFSTQVLRKKYYSFVFGK